MKLRHLLFLVMLSASIGQVQGADSNTELEQNESHTATILAALGAAGDHYNVEEGLAQIVDELGQSDNRDSRSSSIEFPDSRNSSDGSPSPTVHFPSSGGRSSAPADSSSASAHNVSSRSAFHSPHTFGPSFRDDDEKAAEQNEVYKARAARVDIVRSVTAGKNRAQASERRRSQSVGPVHQITQQSIHLNRMIGNNLLSRRKAISTPSNSNATAQLRNNRDASVHERNSATPPPAPEPFDPSSVGTTAGAAHGDSTGRGSEQRYHDDPLLPTILHTPSDATRFGKPIPIMGSMLSLVPQKSTTSSNYANSEEEKEDHLDSDSGWSDSERSEAAGDTLLSHDAVSVPDAGVGFNATGAPSNRQAWNIPIDQPFATADTGAGVGFNATGATSAASAQPPKPASVRRRIPTTSIGSLAPAAPNNAAASSSAGANSGPAVAANNVDTSREEKAATQIQARVKSHLARQAAANLQKEIDTTTKKITSAQQELSVATSNQATITEEFEKLKSSSSENLSQPGSEEELSLIDKKTKKNRAQLETTNVTQYIARLKTQNTMQRDLLPLYQELAKPNLSRERRTQLNKDVNQMRSIVNTQERLADEQSANFDMQKAQIEQKKLDAIAQQKQESFNALQEALGDKPADSDYIAKRNAALAAKKQAAKNKKLVEEKNLHRQKMTLLREIAENKQSHDSLSEEPYKVSELEERLQEIDGQIQAMNGAKSVALQKEMDAKEKRVNIRNKALTAAQERAAQNHRNQGLLVVPPKHISGLTNNPLNPSKESNVMATKIQRFFRNHSEAVRILREEKDKKTLSEKETELNNEVKKLQHSLSQYTEDDSTEAKKAQSKLNKANQELATLEKLRKNLNRVHRNNRLIAIPKNMALNRKKKSKLSTDVQRDLFSAEQLAAQLATIDAEQTATRILLEHPKARNYDEEARGAASINIVKLSKDKKRTQALLDTEKERLKKKYTNPTTQALIESALSLAADERKEALKEETLKTLNDLAGKIGRQQAKLTALKALSNNTSTDPKTRSIIQDRNRELTERHRKTRRNVDEYRERLRALTSSNEYEKERELLNDKLKSAKEDATSSHNTPIEEYLSGEKISKKDKSKLKSHEDEVQSTGRKLNTARVKYDTSQSKAQKILKWFSLQKSKLDHHRANMAHDGFLRKHSNTIPPTEQQASLARANITALDALNEARGKNEALTALFGNILDQQDLSVQKRAKVTRIKKKLEQEKAMMDAEFATHMKRLKLAVTSTEYEQKERELAIQMSKALSQQQAAIEVVANDHEQQPLAQADTIEDQQGDRGGNAPTTAPAATSAATSTGATATTRPHDPYLRNEDKTAFLDNTAPSTTSTTASATTVPTPPATPTLAAPASQEDAKAEEQEEDTRPLKERAIEWMKDNKWKTAGIAGVTAAGIGSFFAYKAANKYRYLSDEEFDMAIKEHSLPFQGLAKFGRYILGVRNKQRPKAFEYARSQQPELAHSR